MAFVQTALMPHSSARDPFASAGLGVSLEQMQSDVPLSARLTLTRTRTQTLTQTLTLTRALTLTLTLALTQEELGAVRGGAGVPPPAACQYALPDGRKLSVT